MAKKARSGNSYKQQYQAYKLESRWKKNKIRKLEKRLSENPNDTGAEKAIEIVQKKLYGRKKPGQKGWYHPQENELSKKLKTDKGEIDLKVKNQINKIKEVFNDIKPTALQRSINIEPKESIPYQLYKLGLISEKRYKFVESRMGSIR